MATGQVLFQRFFYTKSFVKHYKHLKDEVRDLVFREYANPVYSMLSETEGQDAQN